MLLPRYTSKLYSKLVFVVLRFLMNFQKEELLQTPEKSYKCSIFFFLILGAVHDSEV